MPNRYIVKFVNGALVIFDRKQFENIQVCYLQKDADELASKLNSKGGK